MSPIEALAEPRGVVECVDCDATMAYDGPARLLHAGGGAHVFAPSYGWGDPDEAEVTYVGIGGHTRTVHTDMQLGRGVFRTPEYGVRRALWDAAFGYVSGFRKRDILYYMLTRSLSRRIEARVIAAGR